MVAGALEGRERLQVFQVADVLREKGIAVAREAERVLEFAAHGEHGRHCERQPDRLRREAAPAADGQRHVAQASRHGVVAVDVDVAVVEQEGIGKRGQARAARRRWR